MNDYEISSIAAALNTLRPDWPLKQLRTLLNDERMAHRPRRDVMVALAWVACETASASPYRVLQAGPWWRAAMVEENTVTIQPLGPTERCQICGKSENDCRRNRYSEHDFRVDVRQPSQLDVHRVVETLKAEVQPMTTDKPEARPVVHTTHGDAARELLSPAVSSVPGVSSR